MRRKRRSAAERVQRVLKELEYNTGRFPRGALGEAIALRDRITPELLRIIDDAKTVIDMLVYDESYMAPLYAMYLLAQFREKRAYPLIVDFFSIPGEITLDVMGDVVTEDLGRILASVSGGDTSLIKKLAEDAHANEYVRDAALRGLITLWVEDELPRDEAMAYFQGLFRGGLEREYSYVWTGLVSCSTDVYPEEVLEDIERAFRDDLVEEGSIDLPWVVERLALEKEEVLDDTRRNSHHRFVRDTIHELEWWASFDAQEEPAELARKVGRNDPCPCGSGEKYKYCCGARH